MLLQPSDWYEHDITINRKRQYVVEVFGRTDDERVACVQITGFKPYFYCEKPVEGQGISCKQVRKHDVMGGFRDLMPVRVWQVVCDSLSAFREGIRKAKGQLFESNLPPFMRMFHERDLAPASPIRIRGAEEIDVPTDDSDAPKYRVEAYYQADVSGIEAAPTESIPQLVASYDLEMYSATGLFPQASRDPIIQIGISYRWSDDLLTPVARTVYVSGSVERSDDPEITFVPCADEREMLLKFARDIQSNNPDVMCGYNIFGFDDAYIEDRCKALGILAEMELARCPTITRTDDGVYKTKFSETKKFELASGKYDLRYLALRGRLGLDLLLNMRREHSLDSFKLDNVASVFLRDKVVSYKDGRVYTNSTRGLRNGNYVRFDLVGHTTDPYREGHKFVVSDVQAKSFRIDGAPDLFYDLTDKQKKSLEWSFTKDDVEPAELFRLHRGSPADRARIAKYCIQDCDLVLTLMAKLDTLVNARGMADVCKVPMEYVLRRGQGIKIFSAVVFYASQRDQIIRTQESYEGDTGYEGAIVLPPKIGMYLDQPISVLDFNSLYPSNMIAYNLSPDTLVCKRTFDAEGHKLPGEEGHDGLTMEQMRGLEDKGYVLEEVEYDEKENGVFVGRTVCTFVQPQKDNPMTVGILPKTLDILLKKRKEFKDKMEDPAYDEAQRSVYNGLQLAYKVVANSVYGQTGSKTSPIRKLCVAACTTAAGRKQLNFAKKVVETEFGAQVVYGDTDSIFVKFPTKDLAESIKLGIASGNRITEQCKRPYKIAYEKTFYPFILFCRKRYVGMMYETNPDPAKAKRKSMGIVLKRRDNAPIVKDVFGGALDILMQERDVKKAQAFVNDMLVKVLNNEIALEKFIVSKSLRDDYVTDVPADIRSKIDAKKPDVLDCAKAPYNVIWEYATKHGLTMPVSSIAHRVLADRMTKRDPGTAPKVGDRIQYIYAAENSKAAKQGDRIEEVSYVRKNGLHPDNVFYITNQIQNPVASLFALCIEQLDGYTRPRSPSYDSMFKEFMEKYKDEEEATLAVLARKEKQLETLMFTSSPVLSKIIKKSVRGPMDAFLRK